MIAACPKCSSRYRIDREKLQGGAVRLRCTKCEAVFRVRAPEEQPEPTAAPPEVVTPVEPPVAPIAAPVSSPQQDEVAPAPVPGPTALPEDAPLVLLAIPEPELGKLTGDALEAHGVRSIVVQDGVEAMLETQRHLPVVVLVAADLPKMYGFQVCEVIKRNESLRHIHVVLAGAIHHPDRYRRPPNELYGADAYIEAPDLPEGLLPILAGFGVGTPAATAPEPVAMPQPAPPMPVAAPEPSPEPIPEPTPPVAAPEPAPPVAMQEPTPPVAMPEPPSAAPAPGLDGEHAKAERLARIIVSDIILYNEEKFAQAVAQGNVAQVMNADLTEGRSLFEERIDERVRAEHDYLVEELLRVARLRGME